MPIVVLVSETLAVHPTQDTDDAAMPSLTSAEFDEKLVVLSGANGDERAGPCLGETRANEIGDARAESCDAPESHTGRRLRFGARNNNRASVFLKFLIDTFGLPVLRAQGGVVDVAGGVGELACRLAYCHQTDCVLVEPRDDVRLQWCLESRILPHLPMKWRERFTPDKGAQVLAQHVTHLQLMFEHDAMQHAELAHALRNCALITGMHPDSAAEPIVDVALQLGKPFAIVPCCVFPNSAPHRAHVRTHEDFLIYLQAKHPDIQRTKLAMNGRCDVLYYLAQM
ncbi:hypothetical protein FVE85_2404 [Porphyridium purpureum]|uniref:Methyltransferase domain-containing protein n=1 Tax=Porphyridium purpureum TaxID=35688 RepID=A0A5J4YXD8_PORPP|nr:hypothetical protein FVE85_2404 [Porphyridium purpureum]|eukprot:POR6172..scf209_3